MRRKDKNWQSQTSPAQVIGIGIVIGISDLGSEEEEIIPNSWGRFRKTKGDKGSEVVTGPILDGYFRSDADDTPLKAGNPIYWISMPSGYELSPVYCNRE